MKGQSIWGDDNKPKRNKLSNTKRIYIWEHPKLYGRTCNICHQRITKISDLELDHTRALSKGGKRMALAHAICNRMKRDKGLRYVQKSMGIEDETDKRKKLLKNLSMNQLKSLAEKYHEKPKGRVKESYFSSYRASPTKKQYINLLAGVVSEQEINSIPKEVKVRKRRKRRSSGLFDW